MMCNTCGHEHQRTEQAVRYYSAEFCDDVVEETMMICSTPGCRCYELSPTDYEDRLALIAAGEIDA